MVKSNRNENQTTELEVFMRVRTMYALHFSHKVTTYSW